MTIALPNIRIEFIPLDEEQMMIEECSDDVSYE